MRTEPHWEPIPALIHRIQHAPKPGKSVKYSDDEPRDDHGRWSGGGGDDGGGVATADVAVPIRPEELADRGNSREVTNAEFQSLATEGQAKLAQFHADASPATGLDQNWTALKASSYQAVQDQWGGATIDAHTGVPIASDANLYALTVKPPGVQTISVPIGASEDQFNSAMDSAKASFAPQLQNAQSHLGVFRDDAVGRIDLDPVIVVDNLHDVETIGSFTHAVGGAYNFADGNGYWPPHVPAGKSVKYSDSEERDEHGRWSGGGGGDSADLSALTSSIETASAPVSVGADQIVPLVHAWKSADKPINLESVQVQGQGNEHLFATHATDLTREQMPQIGGDAQAVQQFSDTLEQNGVKAQIEQVDPRSLTATQNELDGRASAAIYDSLVQAQGKLQASGATLMVSEEGDILDGHHRWAAESLYALGHPGYTVPVLRADTGISNLLNIARSYDTAHGIGPSNFGDPSSSAPPKSAKAASFGEVPEGARPCPDPSMPYLWFNGQWVLLAVDSAHDIPDTLSLTGPTSPPTKPGIKAVGQKYSDEQPRDDHGRWTSGGGDDAPTSADLQSGDGPGSAGPWTSDTPSDYAGSVVVGRPGHTSTFSPEMVGHVQNAVEDATDIHPGMVGGHCPLVGVGFASSQDAPPGVSQDVWGQLRDATANDATAETFQFRTPHGDDVISSPMGTVTVINDQLPFSPTPDAAASSQSVYGTTMHEMGHAYFYSHGISTPDAASQLMSDNGISPSNVGKLSGYAASGPHEALAEMFSMAHTPGYSLPSDLAAPFAKLEASVSAKAVQLPEMATGSIAFPSAGSALEARARAATRANLEANTWVGEKRQRPTAIKAADDLASMLRAGKPSARKQWTPPELPRGFEQFSATATLTDTGQVVREHQARVLRLGVDTFEPMIRKFFRGQRDRVLAALGAFGPQGQRGARLSARPQKAKADLTVAAIFDLARENAALRDAYLPALDEVGAVAVAAPPEVSGAPVAWDLGNANIEATRGQLADKVVGINDTTRQAISDQVTEGLRRGYSIPQIANGYPDENYPGIQGVFDLASDARAETIARTESAYAFAAASQLNYQEAGVTHVEIMDGVDYDEECADADGQVWSLDEYAANPIQHPNCTRAASPSDAPITGDDGG